MRTLSVQNERDRYLRLEQGFEVVGDYIDAANEKEALDKFKSGMIEPLAEYTKAKRH